MPADFDTLDDDDVDRSGADDEALGGPDAGEEVICDKCGAQQDPAGPRFRRCLECPDYDLCLGCYARRSVHHPGHAFEADEEEPRTSGARQAQALPGAGSAAEALPAPRPTERRLYPDDGKVYEYTSFFTWWSGCWAKESIESYWRGSCKPCACVPGRRRLVLLRHGSRPDTEADPALDTLGRKQADLAARHMVSELMGQPGTASHIVAIFCSPFLRALETAAPLARRLDIPIFVEWGFSELLAHGWLHARDPLPELRSRGFASLPMRDQLDLGYASAVMPEYPDCKGRLVAGDDEMRRKPLQRHREAAHAALEKADGCSVLVVAHGSTHDFVMGALCPDHHPPAQQTPAATVPHCGITEIVEEDGAWRPVCFGSRPWAPPDYKEHRHPGCPSAPSALPLAPRRLNLVSVRPSAPQKVSSKAAGLPRSTAGGAFSKACAFGSIAVPFPATARPLCGGPHALRGKGRPLAARPGGPTALEFQRFLGR